MSRSKRRIIRNFFKKKKLFDKLEFHKRVKYQLLILQNMNHHDSIKKLPWNVCSSFTTKTSFLLTSSCVPDNQRLVVNASKTWIKCNQKFLAWWEINELNAGMCKTHKLFKPFARPQRNTFIVKCRQISASWWPLKSCRCPFLLKRKI